MRMLRLILAGLLLTGTASAHSLAELRKPPEMIPDPSPGQACPVPPLPKDPMLTEGEGWSLHAGILWRNFDLKGARYYVEYQLLRRTDKGVFYRPFPSLYMLDLNRNGVFDIPGEAWIDAKGDGRCADLVQIQAPHEPEPDLKRPTGFR